MLVNRIRHKLCGEPVCAGTAAAQAFLFTPVALDVLEINSYPVNDIHKELKRLNNAIQKSRFQLKDIYTRLNNKNGADVQYIFKIQLQLLEDTSLLAELKDELLNSRQNIEHVIARHIRILQTRFTLIDDELLSSKFFDIQDVYRRILQNLFNSGRTKKSFLREIENDVIFVAEKLLPSELALLDLKKIKGIIIEEESSFSHVAVMLKSLGIPSVINTPAAVSLIHNGDSLLLDAYCGTVIIWPNDKDINASVKKNEQKLSDTPNGQTPRRAKLCVTADNKRIHLEANISSVNEAREALSYGAEGVGLLRSEHYYMALGKQPSIEEESEFYLAIADILKRKSLTIRLLDLGADKSPPFLKFNKEENPQLGLRGVRYLLANPDLLHRHLSAIIPLCKSHHIKILIPFTAIPEELHDIIDFIHTVCKEQNVNKNRLHIGIMAEIPSAALNMRSFLPKISFASIGTNDLTQYLFAASREQANLEKYRQTPHPIMLRLIKKISHDVSRRKKKLSVCGEAASDPLTAALFVGCGITTLSMRPASIPAVRETINRLSFTYMRRMLRKTLVCETYEQAAQLYKK